MKRVISGLESSNPLLGISEIADLSNARLDESQKHQAVSAKMIKQVLTSSA